ncbi:MAG: hypothetical protein OXU96_06190 [Gammaproteobacteria bacterium]|nr:hypothetical protein [Gammaproteobacteria bacterium]
MNNERARRGVIQDDLTVKDIAAKNPYIDIRLFKEWREKMAVIERLHVDADSERRKPEPKRRQSIPLSALKF